MARHVALRRRACHETATVVLAISDPASSLRQVTYASPFSHGVPWICASHIAAELLVRAVRWRCRSGDGRGRRQLTVSVRAYIRCYSCISVNLFRSVSAATITVIGARVHGAPIAFIGVAAGLCITVDSARVVGVHALAETSQAEVRRVIRLIPQPLCKPLCVQGAVTSLHCDPRLVGSVAGVRVRSRLYGESASLCRVRALHRAFAFTSPNVRVRLAPPLLRAASARMATPRRIAHGSGAPCSQPRATGALCTAGVTGMIVSRFIVSMRRGRSLRRCTHAGHEGCDG